MGDFKRAVPGEPLIEFPARLYNGLIDVVTAYNGASGPPQRFDHRFRGDGSITPVLVQNKTGGDRAPGEVLAIDPTPVFDPDDEEGELEEFQNSLVLRGVQPTWPNSIGRWVVLLDGLADGEIGPAAISGVMPIKIDVTHVDHPYADFALDEEGELTHPNQLTSADYGFAEILTKPTETGEKWVLARLGQFHAPLLNVFFTVPLGVGTPVTATVDDPLGTSTRSIELWGSIIGASPAIDIATPPARGFAYFWRPWGKWELVSHSYSFIQWIAP